MIKLKSEKFENFVICLTESIDVNAELWNTTEIARFSDPMYFGGKDVSVLAVDDYDLGDVLPAIDDKDPVAIDSYPSLMHAIATAIIERLTKDALRNFIDGSSRDSEEFEIAFEREPAFDRDIWEHASHEVKRQLLLLIQA